jgi:DNA-binding beta-propeller fold protein YncE
MLVLIVVAASIAIAAGMPTGAVDTKRAIHPAHSNAFHRSPAGPGLAMRVSTPSASIARPCPGATRCPYATVATIGRRAEGVLRVPEAIALGSHGDVYVADQFSHVIQRFSRAGRFEGEWGSYGTGPGQFGAVGALAVDGQGDVYAVDSTHDRVEVFDWRGDFLRAWGSHGRRLGQFRFGAGVGPDKPPGGGIAVAGPYVYVSDTNDDRVERFTLTGADPVAFTRAGGHHARFAGPRGVAVSDGRLYVADLGHQRVVALTLGGRFICESSRRVSLARRLHDPWGLAVRGARVYAVDDNGGRVVELDSRLRFLRAYSGSGVDRVSKWLRGVALAPGGSLYIADSAHGRVVVLARDGAPLRAWGAIGIRRGVITLPLDVAAARDGGALVIATYGIDSPIYRFDSALHYLGSWDDGGRVVVGRHWFAPTAAAVAPDGSLWVTDRENDAVRHLDRAGSFLGTLGLGSRYPLAHPEGVAVGPDGDVYVVDSGHGRVVHLTPAGAVVGSFGARGARGARGTQARGRLSRPSAVAVAPDGDVYVADSGHDRVEVFDSRGRLLGAWGGPGAAPGRFEEPAGVAVDARGRVFVSDRREDRIQEFAARGRLLAQWGAPGPGRGELSGPGGIAVDCRGDLLVADTQNNRVEVFRGVAAGAGCAR